MARYLRLTRGAPGVINSEGVEALRLALWEGVEEVDRVTAYSGAPGRQNFRTLANEVRMRLEPIPEGRYFDVGQPDWAGAVGDYETYWSDALGPVVIDVYGLRAILIHLDANRLWAPGSAGCICPITMGMMKTVVKWFAAGRIDYVEVDWGLKSLEKLSASPTRKPEAVAAEIVRKYKAFIHSGKVNVRLNDAAFPSSTFSLETGKGGAHVKVNGVEIKPKSVEVVVIY